MVSTLNIRWEMILIKLTLLSLIRPQDLWTSVNKLIYQGRHHYLTTLNLFETDAPATDPSRYTLHQRVVKIVVLLDMLCFFQTFSP